MTRDHFIFGLRLMLLGLALAAAFSVTALNGRPLYYFDTAGYVDNGQKIMSQLGLSTAAGGQGAAATSGAGQGATGLAADDNSVNGARSAVYSFVAALTTLRLGFLAMPVLNLALLVATLWLAAAVVCAQVWPAASRLAVLALGLLAASAGSLPFYVAYLMPDILTGVLMIILALFFAFGRGMGRWQILAGLGLAGIAVVSHLSHLAIAALMLLAAVVLAPMAGRRRWYVPAVLVALVAGGGLGERLLFAAAAQRVAGSEVSYAPFITARLIQDGVGYDHLAATCPGAEVPAASCALYDALQASDNPRRLTASHIMFEKTPALGSFRLLPDEAQRAVAADQRAFFLAVLLARPVATVAALLGNTMRQVGMNSVNMTLEDEPTRAILDRSLNVGPDFYAPGALAWRQGWLGAAETAMGLVYGLSALGLAALTLWPGLMPVRLRWFILGLALAILANAFVCGAISQPADRYGARAIWLLPYALGLAAAGLLPWFRGLAWGEGGEAAAMEAER